MASAMLETVASRKVSPFGCALATTSAPSVPPAPGRFSITTVWPRISLSLGARTRVVMSVPPPVPKGTTIRIGRVGQAWPLPWARAGSDVAASGSNRVARRVIGRMVGVSSLPPNQSATGRGLHPPNARTRRDRPQ